MQRQSITDMKKAGIIGAAGYTGGELIRLLLHHPEVNIQYCFSRSQTGKKVSDVHTDLLGDTELIFTDQIQTDIDVLFLCLPHGQAAPFLAEHPFPEHIKVIDLSNDFRLQKNASDFVYGLPERNKTRIQTAQRIANPGCFATAIQLALLPLAQQQLLPQEVHISAITGSTGAGVALSETGHFTWRNNNMSVYKAFTHQHLGEIGETLTALQPTFDGNIHFIPYRGNFSRGIIATLYLAYDGTLQDAKKLFSDYYQDAPFVHLSDKNIDVKQVVNTNKCLLYMEKHGTQLMIISIIDNLVKGASGQAVQNMNLLFGWPEKTGLQLKPTAY